MNLTMIVVRLVAACLGLMPLGCSLYQPRPVTFTVRDAETGKPIEEATVQTHYMTMLDFGVLFGSVGPIAGTTDRDGRVSLIVDPHHPRFGVDVEAPGYPGMSIFQGGAHTIEYLPRRWYQWAEECLISVYQDPRPSGELVLPADYRGPVVVYFSPVDVPPARVGQREFSFQVSTRGATFIPQTTLFETAGRFDRLQARFPETPPLQTYTDMRTADQPFPDLVAFRLVALDQTRHAWIFVVGTQAEADTLRKQVWPDDDTEDKAAFDRILAEHPRPEPVSPRR